MTPANAPPDPAGALVFEVRPAKTSDARGILDCLHAAFSPFENDYTAEAFHDTVLDAASLDRRLNDMDLFVATDPLGAVVGTIACKNAGAGEGHIRGMAVRPDVQGSGVAGRLLRAAEQALIAAGCTRITLDTTEPLRRAMRFYERNGFRRSGKCADFFGMPLSEYTKTIE